MLSKIPEKENDDEENKKREEKEENNDEENKKREEKETIIKTNTKTTDINYNSRERRVSVHPPKRKGENNITMKIRNDNYDEFPKVSSREMIKKLVERYDRNSEDMYSILIDDRIRANSPLRSTLTSRENSVKLPDTKDKD